MDEVYLPINEALSSLQKENSNVGGCKVDERRSECKEEVQDLCQQVEQPMSSLILSMDHGTIEEVELKKYLLQRAVTSISTPNNFH